MMIDACRMRLDQVVSHGSAAHAGLLLARYLRSQKSPDERDRSQLLTTVVETVSKNTQDLYAAAFETWQSELEAMPCRSMRKLQTSGRVITGLGDASVLETGIRLHHTYGTPLLAGPGIKGAEEVSGTWLSAGWHWLLATSVPEAQEASRRIDPVSDASYRCAALFASKQGYPV